MRAAQEGSGHAQVWYVLVIVTPWATVSASPSCLLTHPPPLHWLSFIEELGKPERPQVQLLADITDDLRDVVWQARGLSNDYPALTIEGVGQNITYVITYNLTNRCM